MPSALRRILALSTLLSTLLGGLGWSHAGCGDVMTTAMLSGAPIEHGAGDALMVAGNAESETRDEQGRCHDVQGTTESETGAHAALCSMMAHCGSAALDAVDGLELPHALAEAPHEGRNTRPLDPGHEPEPEPPRA